MLFIVCGYMFTSGGYEHIRMDCANVGGSSTRLVCS